MRDSRPVLRPEITGEFLLIQAQVLKVAALASPV
jgi:hypothetical protein